MTGRRVTIGNLVYRTAHWKDWVDVVAKRLFAIMYRLNVSVETMVGWLNKLKQKLAGPLSSHDVPEVVVDAVAEASAAANIPIGDFINSLTRRLLEDPPKGYRKKKDDLGQTFIVKQQRGPKSTERPVHKGAKFRNKVFVGGWWYTDNAKSRNNVKLRNLFKKAGGGVFHKERTGLGFLEYLAYAIVPESEALSLGLDLKQEADDLEAEEGDRDYRLSAVHLDSLAEGEPVKDSDTFTAPQIFKSVKFNWELKLPDLLNARSKNQKLNKAVKKLLKDYRP
jgi:hypothetical protein